MVKSFWKRLKYVAVAASLASALLVQTGTAEAALAASGKLYRWDYASTAGWKVDYYTFDRFASDLAYCQMTRTNARENTRLRFTAQPDKFTAEFTVGYGNLTGEGSTFPASYQVDNLSQQTNMQRLRDPEGVVWNRISKEASDTAGIGTFVNGQQLNIDIGSESLQFTLAARPAFDMLFECVNNIQHKGQAAVQGQRASVSQASPVPDNPYLASPVANLTYVEQRSQPNICDLPGNRQVLCSLIVNGNTYLSGSCGYEADPDGSFRLFGNPHTVYLSKSGKNTADAFWNDDPASTHAQAPLGELRRDGACWVNRDVVLCAWDK
jgi:hypothetical protein